MSSIIESITAEYLRYKALGEGAIRQVAESELSRGNAPAENSIAVICWHISGNLRSRFTDFLTADGEKPWRNREEEFVARSVSRDDLLRKWEEGWAVLLTALDGLDDGRLGQTVTIRGQSLLVHEALHRSLAHLAYHVGQIVYIAKSLRRADWTYLSIPPRGSTSDDAKPDKERRPDAAKSQPR
jgi:hypothetical protein